MSSIIPVITTKMAQLLGSQHKDHQKNSTLNQLPYELQMHIFQYLLPHRLVTLSLVCKEWKRLCHNPALWKILGTQLGISSFSANPLSDYRFHLVFSKLNFKKHLGDELLTALAQLPIWKDEMSFKFSDDFSENGVHYVSDLTKWQHKRDKRDHFGKKIVGNNLFLIFVTADR